MLTTATRGSGRTGRAGRANGAATVAGRPREEQPREIRNTDAGRFGQHLESLIADGGMTVPEFAKKIGKTPAVVNYYLKGVRTPPFASWRKLSKVLRLSDVRELLPPLPN